MPGYLRIADTGGTKMIDRALMGFSEETEKYRIEGKMILNYWLTIL
jgi:hypothetical protein